MRCDGEPVSEITIRTQPPYPNGILKRWDELLSMANRLHRTTDEDVVRRFLALEVGRPCTELRRAESERLLRAQPFLADATVTAFSDGAGGVRVEVVTVDELSLVGGASASSESPFLHALRVGDGNVLGSGTYVAAGWRDGGVYRDAISARVVDHQFLGRPYKLELAAERGSLGGDWRVEASHPFYTDLQRIAWRAEVGRWEGYFRFLRPGDGMPALRTEREWADVGGIVRIGEPGRLSLFGASVSQEEGEISSSPVLIEDSGLVSDTSSVLVGRYQPYRSVRANLLWGVRNLASRRVEAFDAISGAQDVLVGFQLGTLFGRSLPMLGSNADDIFVSASVYGGYGGPRAFAAVELRGEGRQNYDENRWEGVLGSGRLGVYFRPHPRHTLIGSAEWAGGWRQRAPYQLALGDREGGVRGYRDSRVAGAQRAVVRLEERWFLGRPRGSGDLAVAVFADAGRVWAGEAGDVPYAVSSPVKWAAGVSLLAAVPPRSRQTYRVDLAFPLSPDGDATWELRFTVRDLTRAFFREPSDVARSREQAVPDGVFRWP